MPVNPTDPIITRCRVSVIDTIAALALPNLATWDAAPNGIIGLWYPNIPALLYPCVVVTHQNCPWNNNAVVVGTRDWGIPFRVMIMDGGDDQGNAASLPKYDLWREMITLRFDGYRLPNVAESVKCEVEDDVYGEPELTQYESLRSQLVIRAWVRLLTNPGA
jgi:hypothetical protein